MYHIIRCTQQVIISCGRHKNKLLFIIFASEDWVRWLVCFDITSAQLFFFQLKWTCRNSQSNLASIRRDSPFLFSILAARVWPGALLNNEEWSTAAELVSLVQTPCYFLKYLLKLRQLIALLTVTEVLPHCLLPRASSLMVWPCSS